MPLLEALTGELGENSAQQGVAQYYTGVAQAGLLNNQNAIKAFITFLQTNPEAPERLRENAVRQFNELHAIEKGKLSDIRQRMDFSRRRLELTETDADTQDQQQQIVTMLGKLIKEEEKKENSQKNSGKPKDKKDKKKGKENSSDDQKKPGEGEKKPNPSKSESGSSSSNANGVAELKTYDGAPASPWSRLRDRNRDAANNAFKDKLPARYRELVESTTRTPTASKPTLDRSLSRIHQSLSMNSECEACRRNENSNA